MKFWVVLETGSGHGNKGLHGKWDVHSVLPVSPCSYPFAVCSSGLAKHSEFSAWSLPLLRRSLEEIKAAVFQDPEVARS